MEFIFHANGLPHASNNCRVTSQYPYAGVGAEKWDARSIRFGMSLAFLPDSEVFTLFLLSLEGVASSICTRGHGHCVRCSHRARLLQVRYIIMPLSPHSFLPSFRSTTYNLTPLSTHRNHVVYPLLKTYSLTSTSFQHARLGSVCQPRQCTRPHRGACHLTWLPTLCVRRLWRVSFM